MFFGVLFNSCAAHFWVGRKAPLAMLPEIAWAALISAFLAVRRKEQGDRLPTIFRQNNLALRYSSNVTNTRREREYLASRINHCMKFSRNWITCRRIRQTQTFSLNHTLCVRSSLWSEIYLNTQFRVSKILRTPAWWACANFSDSSSSLAGDSKCHSNCPVTWSVHAWSDT